MTSIKNRIKVYARLKKESRSTKLLTYDVFEEEMYDNFCFSKETLKKQNHNFRFDRVFTVSSDQSEVFETIAKPVIDGMFNGFNGTIFAYGQTGSGKTYALTGSQYKFAHRGLIPRTIEYIFKNASQKNTYFDMSISYLEIYNEVAYDLLSTKDNASTLEELPRIVLLEDNKGEAHYKNLTIKAVKSENQAMHLLYLGDTNRTIAETPLNEYSSRSHCIFTVYLVIKNEENGKIKKAKLNLVDLAGSERLHKINLDGVTLSEAKSINLSLHYLEQVILALSESKRPHIPFRNSVMTFMLRDSIAGNCTTVMLATLSLCKNNYEETLTTCKFAQRVSLIKNYICVNEEVDNKQQIALLKNQIKDLKKTLVLHGLPTNGSKELSKSEEAECKEAVKKFLNSNIELPFNEIYKLKYCTFLLKEQVKKKDANKTNHLLKFTSEAEKKYKELLKQKDTEIALLLKSFASKELTLPPNDEFIEVSKKMMNMDKEAFKDFISCHKSRTQLQLFFQALQEKHRQALELSQKITESQTRIMETKRSLNVNPSFHENIQSSLKNEQEAYRELLAKMENLKSELEFLKRGLSESKTKIIEDFQMSLRKMDNNSSIKSSSKIALKKFNFFKDLDVNNKDEKFDINKKLDDLFNNTNKANLIDINNGESLKSFTKNVAITDREPPDSIGDTDDCFNIKLKKRDLICNNASTQKMVYKPDIKEETRKLFLINNDFKKKESNEIENKSNIDNTIDPHLRSLINQSDCKDFVNFIKGVPLTGDFDVDEEIVKFYRIKFKNNKNI